MEKAFWQDIAEKIWQKERFVAARSRGKVPYTAEGGVFDDKSQDICWWTNGFYAGLLWQLWNYREEPVLRERAEEIEQKLDKNLMTPQGMDHDSGFKWLLTAVADYKLTGSAISRDRALLAANDLAGRFNLAGGFLRAWNDKGDGETAGWAIIDCMMNLPLLFWAGGELNDPRFALIACRHAQTAQKAFLREDGSACHIVVFDPISGKRLHSLGGQGYAHGSSWTRGQAWALYGFSLAFRHTGREEFLAAAERSAAYFSAHIPESALIPADFCQPENCPLEDSSAGAIAACGFLELFRLTGKGEYKEQAETLLLVLLKERCDLTHGHDELLEGGTVAFHDAPRHIPLIYGDYFFTEAVLKLIDKDIFLW